MGNLRTAGLLLLTALVAPLPGPPAAGAQGVTETKAEAPSHPAFVPVIDLWGAIKDFGNETWLVASSPARLDGRSGAKLGSVLVMGGVFFALDEQIRDELQVEEDRNGLHGLVRDIGDFVEPVGLQGNTNAYWAGLAVLGYLTRQDWLHDPAKQILYSHWIGGLGRQLAGRVVGRRRPKDGFGAYDFNPGDGTSFPSGHSAAIFELAYVLNHHINKWPATVVLYGLAGITAFQRVDSDAHWMSDAWLGSAWGLLVAKTVVAAEESGRSDLVPTIDVGNGRLGIGLAFRF